MNKEIIEQTGDEVINEPLAAEQAVTPEAAPQEPAPEEMLDVVGIRFKLAGKVYYFAPGEWKLTPEDGAIVETARGLEYGFVACANKKVPLREIVPPLRTVLRKATEEDRQHYETNKKKEKEAFAVCLEKIRAHKLDMKLIEAEYTFDNNKLVFYFSADGRVDFRELVKDLASVFRTRIELRQIGIRDEAKLLGGLGICGRPFCCSSFLSDFVQVSIKMAKEQNLSLNSAKISGTCGRLMCCLRYESDVYEEGIRLSPPYDSKVKTPDGIGTALDSNPLTGAVRVRFGERGAETYKTFPRDQLTVLPGEKRSKPQS